jgi:RES domain-containing protein
MPTVYRIFKTKHTAAWSNGEGAFRYGGRWNLPGTRMLYCADTLSLAALELLVNIRSEELLHAYSFAKIEVDEQLVLPIEKFGNLPEDWNGQPPPRPVQQIGSTWVESMVSAVLKVPTVLLPGEFNYLINIAHPSFSLIRLGKPAPFNFDARLLKK